VKEISDSAFDGSPNVVIHAPEGTAADDFAKEHEIPAEVLPLPIGIVLDREYLVFSDVDGFAPVQLKVEGIDEAWLSKVVWSVEGDGVVSVDTFRPDVARMAVEEFGAGLVNDVSEGSDRMFRMVSRLRVPYILMSVQPTVRGMLLSFAEKVQQLRDWGAADIILDPGFGFGKTMEENYQVMNELEKLQVMNLPLLVGISRKSMIYRLFGCTPDESLNGTTVLNTIALMKGASILRVHDVKAAVECCKIVGKMER
jgi:dihydropteroate synthase